MNTQLETFSFHSSKIRTISTESGEIFFVAKDVASTLGYSDTVKAVSTHCKKAKSLIDIGEANHPPQQNQQLDSQTKLIPESDVYRLVMRSKLQQAEEFQDWVCEEVIPSIRKHGSYAKPAVVALEAKSDHHADKIDTELFLDITQMSNMNPDEIFWVTQGEWINAILTDYYKKGRPSERKISVILVDNQIPHRKKELANFKQILLENVFLKEKLANLEKESQISEARNIEFITFLKKHIALLEEKAGVS